MPAFLRKFIGLLLIFATVGVASCQALLAPWSPGALAIFSLLPH